MRTISQEEAVLLTRPRSVLVRVLVRALDGTWNDLSQLAGYNWIDEVAWEQDIDNNVSQATIRLLRNIYSLSLSTYMGGSKINRDNQGNYRPLLDVGYPLRIETAVVPELQSQPGSSWPWRLVFDGEIEEVDLAGDEETITVTARDLGCRLVNTFIEQVKTYGTDTGVPVETVMQQILDDNMGAGAVSLYTPVSPNWYIKTYEQQMEPVMEAIRKLAMQIGWDVRYRWDTNTSQFRLTFYQPDRAKTTPDWTFGPGEIYNVTRLAVSRAGVRNVVRVVYSDASSGGTRRSIVLSDQASITRYGRRFMEIAEASSSLIDSEAEATRLAQAALDDLKEPKAEQEVEIDYFYPAEVGDLYRFRADGIHYDADQDLAVVQVRHRITRDEARTTLLVRGRVAGAYRQWLMREVRPGIAEGVDTTPPSAPAGLTVTPGPGRMVTLSWTASPEEDVAEYQIWRKEGNTPSDPTGAVRIADEAGTSHIDATCTPGVTYTWFVRAVDYSENVSAFSQGVSATVPATSASTDPPSSLASIWLSVSSTQLYLDAYGFWRVRVQLSASSIPSDPNRAYIQVKHRAASASAWDLDDQIVVASGSAMAWVDDLEPGWTYEFALVPVSHYGVAGTGATLTYTTPVDTGAPGIPTNLTATPGPGKVVTLTWTAPSDRDVAEYEIWRKNGGTPSDPSGATKIAEVADTTFVDTTGSYGSTYTWFVRAVDHANNVSGFSYGAIATVPYPEPNTTTPTSLTSIGLSVTNSMLYQDAQGNWFVKVTLSLTNIPADTRRAYIQIKHRRQGSESWALDGQLSVSSGSATASIDDLLPNVTYEFAATPVTHFGIEGAGKSVAYLTPKDATPPGPPTGVVVTSIIRGIAIKWDRPAEKDYDHTEVHISTNAGFTPDRTNWTTLKARVKGTSYEWTDGAVAGTGYYVRLVNVDTSGNASYASQAIYAVAGKATSNDYGSGTVNTTHIVQGAITGMEVLEVAVSQYDSVTGGSAGSGWVDIPGFSITFNLAETAACMLYMTMQLRAIGQGNIAWANASTQLVLDGYAVPGSYRNVDINVGHAVPYPVIEGTVAVITMKEIAAGTHTLKGIVYAPANMMAQMGDRILGIGIWKR